MKRFTSRFCSPLTLGFALLLFCGPQLLSDSEITVKGTVLYSFTEPHALIQTKDFVARIILKNLNALQRKELENVGSKVTIRVPQTSVDLVWPVNPNQNETAVYGSPTRPSVAKVATVGKNQVSLEGKVLISFGQAERLIQVGDYVYRINLDALSKEARAKLIDNVEYVSMALPARAIVFAWRFEPEIKGQRLPSSQSPEHKVEFEKDNVIITGRALASFSEPHVLVEAGGKIYKLRKKDLPKSELMKVDRAGNEVTVRVPTQAIEYYWPTNP